VVNLKHDVGGFATAILAGELIALENLEAGLLRQPFPLALLLLFRHNASIQISG
jgi:hypothetical protein